MPLLAALVYISIAAVQSQAQARPSLELLDVKPAATQTAITLEGQVKNISSSDIHGVTVYCDFNGASGKPVRTEPTTLDPDPLSPNKVAQFKCSTKSSQEIKGYNVRFERLFGGPLIVKPGPNKK
jgi:hypothetical protein